jgi:2-polyprenyl-3-methyl-5-hydroxy-6-metoxy-1,4-benzoquinol methylase
VAGCRILEIGCGSGELALTLAEQGASVVGLDIAGRAIEAAKARAELLGLGSRVQFRCGDVTSLDSSACGEVDLLVGKFVLHHLEPFELNVDILSRTLSPAGRCVFWENSSANSLLMFARKHIIGRFGVPKFGDTAEYPLSKSELCVLKRKFNVKVLHPELVFFQLASAYLLRSEKLPRWIRSAPALVDRRIQRLLPDVKRFSYYQVLTMHPFYNRNQDEEAQQ